jgi:hypothetical protein
MITRSAQNPPQDGLGIESPADPEEPLEPESPEGAGEDEETAAVPLPHATSARTSPVKAVLMDNGA